MARNTTLSAAAAHGRRSADAGDPGSSCKVWAVRLPAHHGAVAERGVAGGEGSSAADLATRRAESAAEAAATRAVVARGWFVCAVAPRAGESCVELRFREGDNARWTGAARPGGDRRVHAGVFGAAGGAAFGKLAGDRNVGGCDVGARDSLAAAAQQSAGSRGRASVNLRPDNPVLKNRPALARVHTGESGSDKESPEVYIVPSAGRLLTLPDFARRNRETEQPTRVVI